MNYWITLTPDMLAEVMDAAELAALTAADEQGSIIPGLMDDVTASVREAISANGANVMHQDAATIPRTLKPEALDMIAWRLLKRFAAIIPDERTTANTAARERLEAVRSGAHRVIGPDGRMPVPAGKMPYVSAPAPAYGTGACGLFPSPRRGRDQSGNY